MQCRQLAEFVRYLDSYDVEAEQQGLFLTQPALLDDAVSTIVFQCSTQGPEPVMELDEHSLPWLGPLTIAAAPDPSKLQKIGKLRRTAYMEDFDAVPGHPQCGDTVVAINRVKVRRCGVPLCSCGSRHYHVDCAVARWMKGTSMTV